MSLTQDKFNQGMTSQEYLDQIKVNKQAIEQIYANVETPAEATSFFDGFERAASTGHLHRSMVR